jgi:DNA modification methylase
MDNLLYYHTKPLDIVYDPFAGDGVTIDTCRQWFRRYYCSDMIVKPGREKDIIQRNIQDGLPGDLQKPDLVFLDPPYWIQAEGKYSDKPDDLGNMGLNDFYSIFQKFLSVLINKKVKRIAIIIQPTQFKNNFVFEDHIFKFNEILSDKYNIEMRYILPYSSQQYTPQAVEIAKEKQKCLTLNRDLVIWKIM